MINDDVHYWLLACVVSFSPLTYWSLHCVEFFFCSEYQKKIRVRAEQVGCWQDVLLGVVNSAFMYARRYWVLRRFCFHRLIER